jgi:hypothetical protein
MSRPKAVWVFLFLLSLSFLPCQVWAHTPLSPKDEIHGLDTAFAVPNPTKSWTLYRELHHEGEAEYYKLHLRAGERLKISLFVKEIESGFSPHLIVMAQDLPMDDSLPSFIEKPEGFGSVTLAPSIPENRAYEPFTPTSYYYLIDVDDVVSLEGDYYVVVYEPASEEGKYGMAIGYREEFTLSEWLLIPLDVIGIHRWEGQSLAVILAPLILSLALGLFLLVWKGFARHSLLELMGSVAGLLYVGSGLMVLMQLVIALADAPFSLAVALTVVFVALPLLLGYGILRKTVRVEGELAVRDRFVFVGLGMAGLFLWSGLLVGPALVIITGFVPNNILGPKRVSLSTPSNVMMGEIASF